MGYFARGRCDPWRRSRWALGSSCVITSKKSERSVETETQKSLPEILTTSGGSPGIK